MRPDHFCLAREWAFVFHFKSSRAHCQNPDHTAAFCKLFFAHKEVGIFFPRRHSVHLTHLKIRLVPGVKILKGLVSMFSATWLWCFEFLYFKMMFIFHIRLYIILLYVMLFISIMTCLARRMNESPLQPPPKGKFTDEYQGPTVIWSWVVRRGSIQAPPHQNFRRGWGGYGLPKWVCLEVPP